MRYLDDAPRSNRIVDPEVLKSMGNEAYKQGRFAEALALYDRAIAVDSNKATYHCNKSAALIGFESLSVRKLLGFNLPMLELTAVWPCTIYFRLGEAENALNRNKKAPYVDSKIAFQAQALQDHLDKCIEARKVSDWKTILKETQSAISLGADSAPQVYALQTKALLKLLRHQEAYATYKKMQ